MKKSIFGFFLLAIASLCFGVHAQGLGDLIDSLGSEINFGYTTTQKISIKEITNEKVVIQSPVIKNQSNQNITKYTVMYSEYPLTQILENTNLLNQTKEKAFELTGAEDPFFIEIKTTEGLDITKKYYAFVIPKDGSGNLGEVSNEIRFSIMDKTYGDAGSNEANSVTETHSAAGADMSLANITHAINGNTISLKWIAVNGSNNIDLSVMTPGSSSFNRVATINMNDQNYSFIANRNGEYVFQFTPDNGGKQVNYTVQLNTLPTTDGGTPTPTKTGITKVPRTGPAGNMAIIIVATFLGYYAYKKLYRKAK